MRSVLARGAAVAALAWVLGGCGSAGQPAGSAAPRPGQYWYTLTEGTERLPAAFLPARGLPSQVTVRTQTWEDAAGTVRTRTTYDGRGAASDTIVESDGAFPPSQGIGLFSYAQLRALPSSPRALYERISGAVAASLARPRPRPRLRLAPSVGLAHVEESSAPLRLVHGGGPAPSANASLTFSSIEALEQSPLPASVRSALFRAATLIPGVRVVASASAGLRRTGTAVELGGPSSAVIFDPSTGALVGERQPFGVTSATVVSTGAVDSIDATPVGSVPANALAAARLTPTAAGPGAPFTVHLPGAGKQYTLLVTGPTGASCDEQALPLPSTVGGSAPVPLHPPSGDDDGRGWCPGVHDVQLAALAPGQGLSHSITLAFTVQ